MSWGFSIIAKSKDAAKSAVQTKFTESHGHLLKDVVDLIVSRIDSLGDAPNWLKNPVLKVDSNGHFDQTMGGNATLQISWGELSE